MKPRPTCSCRFTPTLHPCAAPPGVETYYLNFTTSRSALDLAARENSGSQMTVYELQGLLEKIALKDKVEESREFATRVQTALYNLSAKTPMHGRKIAE